MIQVGQTVETSRHGLGVVKSIDGSKSMIDFNGEIKEMLTMLLKEPKQDKVKNYMKDTKEDVYSFTSIVNLIKGSRVDRGFGFENSEIFNNIERKAMQVNHLASKIIEDARNGKFISDKQAMVVAYFAKENNFLNA